MVASSSRPRRANKPSWRHLWVGSGLQPLGQERTRLGAASTPVSAFLAPPPTTWEPLRGGARPSVQAVDQAVSLHLAIGSVEEISMKLAADHHGADHSQQVIDAVHGL